MVKEDEAGSKLIDAAIDLLQNKGKRIELSGKIRELARPLATEAIVNEIEKLVS